MNRIDDDEEPTLPPTMDGWDADATDGDPDGDLPPLEDPEDEPIEASPRGRRRSPLAGWLLALGGATWLVVGVLRCTGGPPDAPTLTVIEEDESPEPAIESPAEAAPEPAGTRSKTQDAPEPADEEPPDEPDAVDAVPARPSPAGWARDIEPPSKVTYTIRRGGALENVANLFKIYHHEITALNPGVGLDQELDPGTPVIVYRREAGEVSESVGLPSDGSLEGGVPVLAGPGRVLKMIPWKGWGTGHTVALLDRVLVQWSKRGSVQPILVGNLSSRHGGRLEPHGTHQSGRDVDLGYLQLLDPSEELNWREMSDANLDAKETWALLFLLAQTGAVEVIYIDRSIQKLLYDWALEHRLMSKRQLSAWMEYPRATGSGDPVIQHVAGHVDHMHVRFACQRHEDRCQSR